MSARAPRRSPELGIHFVSLGCPKNRVDSEVMLGMAVEAGYRHVASPADAAVIVVNSCAFIGAAERESVQVILEMARHRREGACRCLVVAGCLPQRHPAELASELPEVDHFLGPGDLGTLRDVLRGAAERMLVGRGGRWLASADEPRVLTVPRPSAGARPSSAYLKIGDGCDRSCAFCVIPSIRGPLRSRPIDDLVREAERLVSLGVKELNLVSQDTVAYGRDLRRPRRSAGTRGGQPEARLDVLVERLGALPGLRWIRLLYLYPDELSPALVELLAGHERVVRYVDMPMQHGSDAVLRLMRRGHGARRLRAIIEQLRRQIPGLTLRSTFIVGHPGESPADFEQLCELVRWAEPERLGVFPYSDEPGTESHRLGGKVAPLVAWNRYRRLMALGRRISRRANRALVGRTLEVLVEGASDEHPLVLMGRHAGQAPEIDGQIYLSTGETPEPRPPRAGEMWTVEVTQASDYDLVGEPRALAR